MKHRSFWGALILIGMLTAAAHAEYETRLTFYPPVNTDGVNFANGVDIRGGRVMLVQNGGYFVKNGRVVMNQQQMVAAVETSARPAISNRMPARNYNRRDREPSFLARTSKPTTPNRNGTGVGMRQMLAGVFGKDRRLG